MKKDFPYIIGLDLGITSVGWAVIEIEDGTKEIKHKRLIDTGVRIFESAVNNDNETGAAVRRRFRSARKRLQRRRHRLNRIKYYFQESGLISSSTDLDLVKNTDPYYLRSKALDSRLSNLEIARVLLHLSKRRGFKSNRKNVEKDEGGSSEYGKSIDQFKTILDTYRTVGEAIYKDTTYQNPNLEFTPKTEEELDSTKFGHQKRNRRDSYIATFTRNQIESEIRTILKSQSSKGNDLITEDFIDSFVDLWGAQRNFYNPDTIQKTIGICSIFNEKNGFETSELRAPVHSFGYHTFKTYQAIINYFDYKKETNQFSLTIRSKATRESKRIIITNIENILAKVYDHTVVELKEFSTRHLSSILEIEDSYFLPGESVKLDEKKKNAVVKDKDGQDAYDSKVLIKKDTFLKSLIKSVREFYPELMLSTFREHKLVDRAVIDVLAKYRDESDLLEQIAKNLRNEKIDFDIEKLEKLVADFDTTSKYGDLSSKALWELVPDLAKGKHTQNAIGILKQKYGIKEEQSKHKLLPPVNDHTLTNPRVKRVISQTRKVVNALIKKYDSPAFINVELGRDLRNSEEVKSKISSFNRKLEKQKNEAREEIISTFNISDPSYIDIQKLLLWKSQDCKCMLSMEPILADNLFKDTEIDHAIPWSRIADDSYINRILVTKKVNRDKSNKTPFEYFGADSESENWKQYVNFVNSLFIAGRKKARLTALEVPTDFSSRDLNDTKYASLYIKDYFKNNLKFRDFGRNNRVVTVNGQATSIVRNFLTAGIKKDRSNDRHHALDAIIVGVTTPSIIKKINDYARDNIHRSKDLSRKHLREVLHTIPVPWPTFFADIYNRVFETCDSFKSYVADAETKKVYGDIMGKLKPLFVSRAPNRSVTGPAHAETVYSKVETDTDGKMILSVRKSITSAKDANLNKFGLYKNDPAYLKKVIGLSAKEKELIQKGDVVISKDKSESKKTKIINTRVAAKSNSAKTITRGNHIAYVESGQSMVRVDVFRKDGKHYLIPIYVYDTISPELPNLAIKANKPRDEWTLLDDTFEFRFSLQKNDYIKIKRKKDSDWEQGYYITIDSGTGKIQFVNQDGSVYVNSKGKEERLGGAGATTLFALEKYTVDTLGKLSKVKKEKRRSFNLKYKKRHGI